MLIERVTLTNDEQADVKRAVADLRRMIGDVEGIEQTVAEIVARVQAEGDEAVLEYTRVLDTNGAEPLALRVPGEELDQALEQMPLDVVAGLQVAIANVARVADASIGVDRVARSSRGSLW